MTGNLLHKCSASCLASLSDAATSGRYLLHVAATAEIVTSAISSGHCQTPVLCNTHNSGKTEKAIAVRGGKPVGIFNSGVPSASALEASSPPLLMTITLAFRSRADT